MTTVFMTLSRFPVYFEIHSATAARKNVAPVVKDPVGANLSIYFRERETKERLSGNFLTFKQIILLMGLY